MSEWVKGGRSDWTRKTPSISLLSVEGYVYSDKIESIQDRLTESERYMGI